MSSIWTRKIHLNRNWLILNFLGPETDIMGQFLVPETDRMCQFLDPETDKTCNFLVPETYRTWQFLGPETDIMGERYYIKHRDIGCKVLGKNQIFFFFQNQFWMNQLSLISISSTTEFDKLSKIIFFCRTCEGLTTAQNLW